MTRTVDFDALQADRGPRVVLMQNEYVGPLVTAEAASDFSDFASVYVEVEARLLQASAAPSVVVLVEHSDDGLLSWSTAASFSGVRDVAGAALVSSPKAYMRASAEATHSEWRVVSVTAAPTYLDPVAGGGGSQPGAARWIGPWTIYEAALQAFALGGGPNGGTFTIIDDGDTTAPIAFDAPAADVAAALNALNPAKWAGSGGPCASAAVVLTAAAGTQPVELTYDGSGLTIDGDPGGTVDQQNPGVNLEIEMFTPAVGDIIEDFLIEVVTPPGGNQHLAFKDEDGEFFSTMSAYPDLSAMADGRTNYSGNSDNSNAENAPTPYGIELAGGSPYPAIPCVCLNASAIGAYFAVSAPPVAVIKVWVKTATPVAPS